MCGGTSTTTQSVSIPPEVLARYNAVNARAENVANTPFQPYTGQFVAGLTPTQQAGIAGTSAAANAAQPYYGAATGLTLSGAQDVGPLTQGQIAYYQNPFTQSVVDPTLKALQQQQGQERSQLASTAIRSGAYGGDRAGLERANLARQQTLGTSQAISPLFAQGYQSAVQTAQGQQGVVAQDLARRMQAGQAIAGLGTGAQQAALQGAAAQLQAGTAEQQTQQADLTARYQQFLQERGYPFQVAQFLANIAMGTGALSGSTTTTQQPSSFFSDRRLKHDVKQIGKTNDGLPIYSFKYNGDDKTQIGLMAQDVEKKKPQAVGLAAGYKTVDYDKATEGSERKGKWSGGGLDPNSMGGAVTPAMQGEAMARGGDAGIGLGGGLLDTTDLNSILSMQKQFLGPYAQGGLYSSSAQQNPMGGKGIVPAATLPVARMITAGSTPKAPQSGMSNMLQAADTADKLGKAWDVGEKGINKLKEWTKSSPGDNLTPTKPDEIIPALPVPKPENLARGGLAPRRGFALGGNEDESLPGVGGDTMPGGGDDILEGVVKAGQKKIGELPKPGQAPGESGGLGKDLMGVASLIGAGKTLASAGSAAMEYLPMILAPIGLNAGGVASRKGYAGKDGDSGAVIDDSAPSGPSDEDIDYLARTMLREAGGEGERGMTAVGHVVRNRLQAGKYGDSVRDIVTAPSQFTPWNPDFVGTKADPRLIDTETPGYKTAAALARGVLKNELEDPTGGATHFANVKTVLADRAKQGQGLQKWLSDMLKSPDVVQIGGHTFGKSDAGRAMAYTDQGQARSAASDAIDRSTRGEPSGGVAGPVYASKWAEYLPSKPVIRDGQKVEEVDLKRTLIPLLTGLGAMGASPSRYFGGALLQGLGAGAQSYANLEEQQQRIEESKAREQQGLATAAETINRAHRDTPAGYTLVGFDPVTKMPIYVPMERLIQYGKKTPDIVTRRPGDTTRITPPAKIEGTPLAPPEAPKAPEAPAPAAPSASSAPAAVVQSPIVLGPENKPYTWDVALPKELDDHLTGASDENGRNLWTRLASTPDQRELAQAQTLKTQTETNEAIKDASARTVSRNQIGSGLGQISETGALAAGAGNAFRTELANVYNTLLNVSKSDKERIDPAAVSANEIIQKINTLGAVKAESAAGLRAASIANAINSASPSGNLTKNSQAEILAAMYVEDQKEKDFARFYSKYVSRGGTGYGAREAFDRMTAGQYEQDRTALKKMIGTQFDKGGRKFNHVELLTKAPERAREIDKMYNRPGLSRYVIGG
jgi:spore germination cell wall hydrolase CwlJ-like protein